jgi:hypothetical protein
MKAITYIIWDITDDALLDFDNEVEQWELGLPSSTFIPDDIEFDCISDYLSDEYGYCVKSFYVEF